MLKPVLKPQKPSERRYLSITELNRKVKRLLEEQGSNLMISGEISNFVAAASGHWYFTLKDEQAQVKCTMWRGRNQTLKVRPENGMQVNVRAKMTMYEARGDYQLNIDFLEPAGAGNLQAQFDQLKEKLAHAGLFDASKKRPIPQQPRRVGIITSPSGAAIRDVITVMRRRFPLTEIIIYPCQVQGRQAHVGIIEAINTANQRNEVDVLLLTRGGGSLEDLWCFNEEALAYAIAASQLPTIAAVGHEIDFSIADFVADLRAPTPSAAAELLTPDAAQLRQKLDDLQFALSKNVKTYLNLKAHQLERFQLKLIHPQSALAQHQSQLQSLGQRLAQASKETVQDLQSQLHRLQLQLSQRHPQNRIETALQKNDALKQRLIFALNTQLNRRQALLAARADRLNTVSPLATLSRGYSVTLKSDQLIQSESQVKPGDIIITRVADGEIESQVQQTRQSTKTALTLK